MSYWCSTVAKIEESGFHWTSSVAIRVPEHLQVLGLDAALELHRMDLAVLVHGDLQPVGERIRDPDAVQAAGDLVRTVAELAARVQLGQDELDPIFSLGWCRPGYPDRRPPPSPTRRLERHQAREA